MTNRIKTILSYIDKKDKVADIGCDSAEISITLARNKIHSIAIDISECIIEDNVVKANNLGLIEYIDFRVGDGVDTLLENDANTLVLAGLGSYTISSIIKSSKFKYDKIITISNKNHSYLRKKMLEYGYRVLSEEMILEKNKFYNLIIFIPGIYEYSDKELYVGFNHKNKVNLLKYHEYIIKNYNKYPNFNKNRQIKKLVGIIKNYKY